MFQEFPEEADGYGDLFAFSPSTSTHLRATIFERLTGKKLTVRRLLLGAAEARRRPRQLDGSSTKTRQEAHASS